MTITPSIQEENSVDKKTVISIGFNIILIGVLIFIFSVKGPDYRELQERVGLLSASLSDSDRENRELERLNGELRDQLESGANLISDQGQAISDIRESYNVIRDIEQQSGELILQQLEYVRAIGEYGTETEDILKGVYNRMRGFKEELDTYGEEE
jgi:hypothetical protein